MNVQAAEKIAGIGDNRPALITTEQLKKDFSHLEDEAAALIKQAAAAPFVVEDDEDISVLREIVRGIVGAHQRVESARVETKNPHLEAERVIDGHFGVLKKLLADTRAKLEARAKVYLDKKAAIERAEREEAARKAREEQARLEREAVEAAKASEAAQASAAIQRAAQAGTTAIKAERAVEAKPADMARTRTERGGMATLKQEWDFEIVDLAKIDLEALRPFIPLPEINKAIARFIDTHKGDRELPGVRIFQKTSAQFR